ncbi:unnamed protein product [Symbiodinium sp. CCMP2456]|nr:unnamed protein product [Symbiodinium sp. CCMP2456]
MPVLVAKALTFVCTLFRVSGTRSSDLESWWPFSPASCGGVQSARRASWRSSTCVCPTHQLFGAGCGKKIEELYLPADISAEPLKFLPAQVDDPKECWCLPVLPRSLQSFEVRVRRKQLQQQLKQRNAYSHIQNHALKFCAGLYDLAKKELPETTDGNYLENQLEAKVKKALGHEEAQKICQTALDGQLSPELADEELLHPEHPVQDPQPESNTRLYTVLDRKEQTRDSWKQLLKNVCTDECHDLLGRMRDELQNNHGYFDRAMSRMMSGALAPTLVQATLVIPSSFGKIGSMSVPELCARSVVRKVEAEVLTCCAEECGWDEQQCQLWPFMDASEQRDWNARCCAEGIILKGSSRERLCNSVQPRAVLEDLEKEHIDPAPQTSQDAVRVGQDLEDTELQKGPSLLQAVSVHQPPQCNIATGFRSCKNPASYKRFLELCEKKEEGWQFLASARHSRLKGHAEALKETGVSDCNKKLSEDGIDSVSWLGSDKAAMSSRSRKNLNPTSRQVTTMSRTALAS